MMEGLIQKSIHKVTERMLTPEKMDQVTIAVRKKILEEVTRVATDGTLDTMIYGILMTMRESALAITGEEKVT